MKELLRDMLAPDRLRKHELLNEHAVQSIIAEHESCREDHSDLLLGLLTFELWRSQWLGGGGSVH